MTWSARATGTATCSAWRKAGILTSDFRCAGCISRARTSCTSARARSTRARSRRPISGASGRTRVPATGAIDHVAFRAKGLKDTMAHLRRHKIEFNERRANGQALYQLFMHDPNGIKVELNFDAAEAGGLEPEITAEKLAARK